jgi:hypothetical protein
MKLSSLKTDVARVEQGEWIGDIPEMGDLELKVRGIDNADYRALTSKLVQTIPLKRRRRGISSEDLEQIQNKCLLETVLLDWRGVQDDSGKDVPYSRELAETLLTSPEYRTFRDAVAYASRLVGADEDDAASELEKNSSPSSTGG